MSEFHMKISCVSYILWAVATFLPPALLPQSTPSPDRWAKSSPAAALALLPVWAWVVTLIVEPLPKRVCSPELRGSVAPASVVFITTPLSPTTQPLSASANQHARSNCEVPCIRDDHVLPPSDVVKNKPTSPITFVVFASTSCTPRRKSDPIEVWV